MSYIGNSPITAAFLTDQFSGNGTTTAFTMSVAPANTSSIIVAITGVLQDPSTYSVSGTTLTFSAAPPTGTGNISVRYMGIPASGVTTTAYRTVTDTTATAGQTSFSIPSYTVGYLNVFRNGSLLAGSDYTATTGTTVVLANAASAGDTITTESFYVSSVLNAIPATNASITSSYLASGLTLTSPTLTSPTLTSPTMSGAVVSTMASSVITSGTAVASTSGTSIDFTGIPSWVKRITVMFNGVSTNGSSQTQIQIGSGSFVTTGYISTVGGAGIATSTTGYINTVGFISSDVRSGLITLALLNSNVWVSSGVLTSATAPEYSSGNSSALSGALDRVRITTVNGTDTFDAGSINIFYE